MLGRKARNVKTNPCFRLPHTCLVHEGKTRGRAYLVIFKNQNIYLRTHRELSVDMFIDKGIAKYNQITLMPCFTFILRTRT